MKLYHLWRNDYDVRPFMRWACDVVADDTTPDGYRIVESDTTVADGAFLDRLAVTLGTPTLVQTGGSFNVDGAPAIVEASHEAEPRTPGHFAAAIRQVPGAVIRSAGRAS